MLVNMKVNSSNLRLSKAKNHNHNLRDSHKKLEYPKSRVVKLDTIVQRHYKDNLDGINSSDERFIRMSVTDDIAQKLLKHRLILRQAKN